MSSEDIANAVETKNTDLAPVALPNPPLVSDAKKLIEVQYPKLHGRFNFAFNDLPEDMTLKDAIDAIAGDVPAWLTSMPDNLKSSSHALSRPKSGVSFLLQHEAVRAVLGSEYCDLKNTSIKRAFDAVKKDIVITSDKSKDGSSAAPFAVNRRDDEDGGHVLMEGGEDDELNESLAKVLARNAQLEETNRFLSDALYKVFHDQYGAVPAQILQHYL